MKQMNTLKKGRTKEQVVVRYLKKKGWDILYQNTKFFGVEIDILAKKQEQLCLIEVKSIKKEEHLDKLLKDKQKNRLKKAAEGLCEEYSNGIRLFLAAVNTKNQIEFFEFM